MLLHNLAVNFTIQVNSVEDGRKKIYKHYNKYFRDQPDVVLTDNGGDKIVGIFRWSFAKCGYIYIPLEG